MFAGWPSTLQYRQLLGASNARADCSTGWGENWNTHRPAVRPSKMRQPPKGKTAGNLPVLRKQPRSTRYLGVSIVIAFSAMVAVALVRSLRF
jgi:hypothetical protein